VVYFIFNDNLLIKGKGVPVLRTTPWRCIWGMEV